MTKELKNGLRLAAFYLLSFTWGIIWTIVGLLTLLVLLPFNKRKVLISTYRGRIVIDFPNANFGGASLGIVILVADADTKLLNHEVGHSIQNAFMGPLFIFLVAIPSGIRYTFFTQLSERHFNKTGTHLEYDSVWFEAQATKLGKPLNK